MLKNLELEKNFYPRLIRICKKLKIEFLSTPYNFEDVEFLHKLKVNAYKFSSMHLTETKFIEYVCKKKKPVILSTGMSQTSEIKEAIKTVRKSKNKQLILLQCTTNYPSKIEDSNILCLKSFKKKFKCIIGYSDHTTSNISAITAIALGAKVIEKHFTLDKKLRGPDHICSYNPKEFRSYVHDIRAAEVSLGEEKKKLSPIEKKNVKIMRRSIHSNKLIFKRRKTEFKKFSFFKTK